jgi:hypothetical protein
MDTDPPPNLDRVGSGGGSGYTKTVANSPFYGISSSHLILLTFSWRDIVLYFNFYVVFVGCAL